MSAREEARKPLAELCDELDAAEKGVRWEDVDPDRVYAVTTLGGEVFPGWEWTHLSDFQEWGPRVGVSWYFDGPDQCWRKVAQQ